MPTVSRTTLMGIVALAILVLCGLLGGRSSPIDVNLAVRLIDWRHAHPWLETVALTATNAGTALFLFPLAAIAAAALLAIGRKHAAALLAGTVVAERVALDGLKLLVQRSRPQFELHPVLTHSYSFPSGHAANSMTTFLAIALFALPIRSRPYAIPAAILLAAAVGATRPVLGVHWVSDMVAGWMVAILAILAALVVRDRYALTDGRTGRIEA